MAVWRFLLVFALAFGSVLPHCATATPAPMAAVDHAAMGHDRPLPDQPSKAHVADACVGCAAPVRFALAVPVEPLTAPTRYVVLDRQLTTRRTALDPPPPRSAV